MRARGAFARRTDRFRRAMSTRRLPDRAKLTTLATILALAGPARRRKNAHARRYRRAASRSPRRVERGRGVRARVEGVAAARARGTTRVVSRRVRGGVDKSRVRRRVHGERGKRERDASV